MTWSINSTKCRSCGAPVIWARTPAGKRIPLDLTPTDDGNVLLDDHGTATVMGGLAVWPPGAYRWTSHFASCPQAADHRRPR